MSFSGYCCVNAVSLGSGEDVSRSIATHGSRENYFDSVDACRPTNVHLN